MQVIFPYVALLYIIHMLFEILNQYEGTYCYSMAYLHFEMCEFDVKNLFIIHLSSFVDGSSPVCE